MNEVLTLLAVLKFDKTNFDEGMEDSEKSASNFGSKLKSGLGSAAKVGAAAVAAVGAAAIGAGKALADGIKDVAAYGDNIDKMSQKMGITSDTYQEWDFVMQHCGTSIESLKPSMKTLANAAESGSDAFQKLGISQEEVASLSQEDLFAKTIQGLQDVEDTTERTYLASKLLGRGATELGPLLNMTAEETEAMKQQVHDLGYVLDEEAVKSAAAYQDSLQNLQSAFGGLKNNLTSSFLPAVVEVFDGLTAVMTGDDSGLEQIDKGVNDFITNLNDKMPKALEVVGSILGSIGSAIISNAPKIIGTLADLGTKLVSFIAEQAPSIIETLVEFTTTIITSLAEALPEIFDSLAENLPDTLQTVIDGILEMLSELTQPDNLEGILDSALNLIMALANGIIQSLPALAERLPEIIVNIINTLTNELPKILSEGEEILMSLIDGIINAIPILVSKLPDIITAIINFIVTNLPQILAMGVKLIVELAGGLIKAIPQLVKELPKIVKAIIEGIGQALKKIGEVGLNIVRGLWDGISSGIDWLWDKITGWIGGIWDGILDFFGIASPSKKFKWVGKMLTEGLSGGITQFGDKAVNAAMDLAEEVTDAMSPLNSDYSIATALDGNGNALGSSYNLNGTNINVYAKDGQSAREIAQEVSEIIANQYNRAKVVFA